jgi:hypothetical protein
MLGAVIVALLIIFGLIAVSAAIASTKLREKSRSEAFAQLASELDLTYEPKAPRDFRDAWAVLPQIPKQGDVHHLIYGAHAGVPVTTFRHRYVVSTGQSAAVIMHWVFSTEVPDWPEVQIKRRSAIARAFGKRSNIVLDDEHFDRHWIIKTKNPAFARAMLSPATREFIAGPRADGKKYREMWHIVGGKLCCVVRTNLDAAGVREELRRLHIMLDTLSGQRVLVEALRS